MELTVQSSKLANSTQQDSDTEAFLELTTRVEGATKDITNLQMKVADITNQAFEIRSLDSLKYKLKQPICVMVYRVDGNDFIAEFPDIDAYGTGPTFKDAIDDAKHAVIMLYESLAAHKSDLSVQMMLQYEWLSEVIEQRER